MTDTNRRWLRAVISLTVATCVAACETSTEVARLSPLDASDHGVVQPATDGQSRRDAQPTLSDSDFDCQTQPCANQLLQCGNCVDDDQDGLIDALDPDCWGSCDDSEVTWGHRQDCSNGSCYFDRNCGLGNDGDCAASVPNGCDCFGCCVIDGRQTPAQIGTRRDGDPTCSSATAFDVEQCAPCELAVDCFNACDSDEACFGP